MLHIVCEGTALLTFLQPLPINPPHVFIIRQEILKCIFNFSDDSDSETEDNRSKSKTGNKFEDDAGIFSDESLKEMLSESGTFNDMKSDTLDDDDDDASDAESSTNDVVSRSDDKKSQVTSFSTFDVQNCGVIDCHEDSISLLTSADLSYEA